VSCEASQARHTKNFRRSAAVVDWVTTTSNLVFEVNVTGTVNVIKACEDNAVTALVYTSSVDVMIGANSDSLVDITEDLPLPEETPNGYCRSKQLGERAVMEANSERLHTAVIRPADVWGEGDVYHIGALIEQAKSGFYVTLGDGSAVCQHVYVGNCAHAHVQLARALLDGNERVQARAYLITDAPPSNFFVHFERVLRGVGLRLWPCWRLPYWLCWPLACAVELLYDTCPFLFKKRPGFSRFAVAYCCRTITYSCDRARADFSFEIKYTEDQAMNNTIAYYKRLEQTNNK
jgi:nucleoside-diphosphate-sugar epimerase